MAKLIETDERLVRSLRFPGLIPRALERRAGELVRRKIISATMTSGLLKALVDHTSSPRHRMVAALPGEWRRVLADSGFQFEARTSAVDWAVFVIKRLIAGAKTLVRLAHGCRGLARPSSGYAVLCNLPGTIATSASGVKACDFVDWYRNSSVRARTASTLWLNIPGSSAQVCDGLVAVSQPWPSPTGWRALQWLVEGLVLSLAAVLGALLGEWRYAVVLDELLVLALVRKLRTEDFAAQYLFLQSDFIVRPLWTYLSERAGAEIVLVFYAINCELFARLGQTAGIHTGYNKLDWPAYAVWDAQQASFVQAVAPNSRVDIVGTVAYQDNGTPLVDDGRRYIAVFDVTPIRPALLARMGLPQPYYRGPEMGRFLDDIRDVTTKLGLTPVLKAKREDSLARAPKSYSRRLASWFRSEDARVIDPGIAAERVIALAEGSISCPFSSTALLGEASGKPAAYYDPTGCLEPHHRLARDIPLLRGRGELEQWLRHKFLQPTAART